MLLGTWGFWEKGGGYRYKNIVLSDGVLCIGRDVRGDVFDNRKIKEAFGERYFGNKGFFYGTTEEFFTRVITDCVGKTEKEILEIANYYKGKRDSHRTEEFEKIRKWRALRKRFDGYVIGLDGKADVYDSGFSVRVLFNSDVSFEDRKQFLKENRADFVRWLTKEITCSKRIMNRIGDISFYKPVEIVNLRANEVEVKFDVKKDVMKGA